MTAGLVIHRGGRVGIPKPLREELHLQPGDSLEMESSGDRTTLRPLRGAGPVTKEHGVWAFYSEETVSASATDEMLKQIRRERDLMNVVKGK